MKEPFSFKNNEEFFIKADKIVQSLSKMSLPHKYGIWDIINKNNIDKAPIIINNEEIPIFDKIAIINKGKIMYYGTLDDLRKEYKKKDLEQLFMEVIQE